MASTYPLDDIKKQFPIWDLDASPDLVYLDSAATSQKPRRVISAISDFYSKTNANVHRSTYDLAEKATLLYEEARIKVQEFINAGKPQEIIFTSGTTDAINMVVHGFVSPRLNGDDEVVVTTSEHHSNLVPWQQICELHGANLKIIPINRNGDLNMGVFKRSLNAKTRIVAVSHVSNSLGTINPVKEIISDAQNHGIPVLVDGAQNVAHHRTDVQDLDADFYAFSGHKIYGPTGTGVLFGKAKWLQEMKPFRFGGEMVKAVRAKSSIFKNAPQKFEAGTPNIAGVVGLGEAITFINDIGINIISERNQELLTYTEEKLSSIDRLHIIGTSNQKSGIISFIVEGVHPHDIGTYLNAYNIAARSGHHCSQPVMDFMEIPGTTRISFGIYNDKTDIDCFISTVKKASSYFD